MCLSVFIFIRIEYVCEIRLPFQIDFPIGLKIEIEEKKDRKKSVYTLEYLRVPFNHLYHKTHMKFYFLTAYTATTIF